MDGCIISIGSDKLNKLKNRLLYLASGEFAAICSFIIAYRVLNLGRASLTAFSFLVFILLQGSMYWLYRYKLLIKRALVGRKAIKLLSIFRYLNMILLLVIAGIIPILKSDYRDLFVAIGLFLFSIIEFINYYWYRLSYGKWGFNIRILLNTGLEKSSINKLINKYLLKKHIP